MSLSINTNINAQLLAGVLKRVESSIDQTSQRLATGKRINSAKDDPAGLAIATQMKTQNSSWAVAQKNITFGTSMLETSAAALGSVQEVLQNMRDLAVEASNGTLSTEQRAALQTTFVEYQAQLDQIVGGASIFGKNLISSTAADVVLQTGINAGDTTTVVGAASDGATLGVNAAAIDVSTDAGASAAITAIDAAVTTVSSNQATFGAQLRGLDVMVSNIDNMRTNLSAAIGRIEDANIAEEVSKLTMLQTQQQMAIQMLGIVNQFPQNALSLLR